MSAGRTRSRFLFVAQAMRVHPLHLLIAGCLTVASLRAQVIDSSTLQHLQWRNIGPHRAGRTVGAAGVPQRPGWFYIGVNNGGVWRTTDYGRVWTPIFDAQPTGSIGDVAVAPSDPDGAAGSERGGLQRLDLSTGDGMYRSMDGGATWVNTGLRDAQQIARVVVHPTDPRRVFVAALGHPYGPNTERGIFRTTDNGATWERVLFVDENTGGMDIALEPGNPSVVYAVLWAARQAPWEIGSSWTKSSQNGLFKSVDGGTTWRRIGSGLPTAADGLGRIGIATSDSRPARLFAVVGARSRSGVYRSDDGGESWQMVNSDRRLWERDGDFNEIRVDPTNADVAYVANVVTWKTTDGGATFTAIRGAPGGDDYHRIWINPKDSKQILLTSDQGAIITVNGGATFSSWYNQPTAQFYHVSADNAFPYRVCGGQQESGSACVASRGRYGQTSIRDWTPVGVEEYGYAVADPKDPDIVYGGKVTRFDRRTGQVQQVGPKPLRGPGYRVVRTAPVVFSGFDSTTLYFASNVLWSTRDGGQHWVQRSPDLTRATAAPVPATLGVFSADDPEQGGHRGVIYTIAPSPRDPRVVWVGTDDGLIQVTGDSGRTWANVTPPELTPWAKVSIIDASPHDANVAYAAVNTFRLDDLRPHIFRTRDRGRSWQRVVNGIPDGGVVNVVREDPVRRGLLFAGTERAVYVSVDDGEQWQSLRRNMPATSIRDLVIKDEDVVVGTHGRSFWILDGITTLRRATRRPSSTASVHPSEWAWRLRWNLNTDTPIPQEEPAGQNAPEGVAIDYILPQAARRGDDRDPRRPSGALVRRYASDDPAPAPLADRNIPDYWIRPPVRLGIAAGSHRMHWDARYADIRGADLGFPIAASVGNTPVVPRGPLAPPGQYRVRLTVDSAVKEQTLRLRRDPTLRIADGALREQYRLAAALADGIRAAHESMLMMTRVREALGAPTARQRRVAVLASLDSTLSTLERGGSGATALPAGRLRSQLQQLFEQIDGVDATPTAAQQEGARNLLAATRSLVGGVEALRGVINGKVNQALRSAGVPVIEKSGRPSRSVASGGLECSETPWLFSRPVLGDLRHDRSGALEVPGAYFFRWNAPWARRSVHRDGNSGNGSAIGVRFTAQLRRCKPPGVAWSPRVAPGGARLEHDQQSPGCLD
ncbi:MAG: hypothetical protein U5K74_04130 [Gemmatimonadaceae bacterium]|nr:hypothetical protein [Gemmatimonadaceae bacterium]